VESRTEYGEPVGECIVDTDDRDDDLLVLREYLGKFGIEWDSDVQLF